MGSALVGALVIGGVALLLGVGIVLGRAALPLFSSHGAVRLRPDPIPDTWAAIVDRYVPLARTLSADERHRLLRLVQVFIHDKRFEGCKGLAITDEMRVTIAAHACLLVLHLDGPLYPTVARVLVYPTAFVPRYAPQYRSPDIEPVAEPSIGEAWPDGAVVLSWDDVRADASHPALGENVVLHEFAHELDFEDGAGQGRPLLGSPSLVRTWARVLSSRYEQLRRDARHGRPTVLDPYGTTDLAEFFAVATETFFTKPRQFKASEPTLYRELVGYFGQDPAARVEARTPAGRHRRRPPGSTG